MLKLKYLKFSLATLIFCCTILFIKGQCNISDLTGSFPQTINGVTVSITYSGANAGLVPPAGYPQKDCIGTGLTTVIPWLGNSSTPTSITFTFSSQINNVIVATLSNGVKGLLSQYDNLIFSTNGGTPTLLSVPGLCQGGMISGANYSANYTNTAELIQITAPNNYTILTISQIEDKTNNGGSTLLLCPNSITTTPVSLINFSAFKEINSTRLKWQTASEYNSKAFVIQRSLNNSTNWQSIANLPASGNSNSIKNYSFIDGNVLLSGVYYYRLQCVNLNDKPTFSETKKIVFSISNKNLNIYPIPVKNELTITGTGRGCTLQLIDNTGLICFSKITAELDKINLNNLPAGLYFLKLITNDGNINTFKIIKN